MRGDQPHIVHPGTARLLIRPPPYGDELAWSYLVRLANANGWSSLYPLQQVLRDRHCHDLRDALSVVTGVSAGAVNALQGPFPVYWRQTGKYLGLAAQDFNHALVRWCPQCLRDSAYLRAPWSIKLVCVCTEHKSWLRDRCPLCGESQLLNRTNLFRCNCGAYLANAALETVSEKVVGVTRNLVDAIFGGNSSAWPQLKPQDWIRLIRYLGQFAGVEQPKRPGQISGLELLENARPVVEGTADLLSDWPRNFHRLLAATLHGKPNTPSLRVAFGRLYGVIYGDLADESFQFLRNEFEAFLNESWWGMVCKRHRRFSDATADVHPRLSLKQAAQSAGIGLKTMKQLGKASVIPVAKASTQKGRTISTIHRAQLELISGLAGTASTLNEAVDRLAIPKRRVRELIDGKVIVPLADRRHLNASRWLIPVAQISTIANLAGDAEGEALPVGRILKHWRLDREEFCRLVQALLEGKLKLLAMSSGEKFGCRCLDKRAFCAWIDNLRREHEKPLSVDQAAVHLGIKQQVAYDLVRTGLLRACSDQSPIRITPKAVSEFKNTYVSLAELARKSGESPRRLLAAIDAQPVSGPRVDACRQYYFRRSDLSHESMFKTMPDLR